MKAVMARIVRPILWVYHQTHWFTDKEAWGVFRFFAFAEAVGWTLLIGAILYRNIGLPEADSVISFAGHIHGMLFGLYFVFVLVTARSMEWGLGKITAAIIAGMPPYGSVLFEQYMAFQRKRQPVYVEPPKDLED